MEKLRKLRVLFKDICCFLSLVRQKMTTQINFNLLPFKNEYLENKARY